MTPRLFAIAAFASAFLIFLVQPMVGKRILPWFGGGPGVWTLCLMFYQAALFLGYAYAHALARFAPPRAQLVIHGVVFFAAAMVLPVLPGDGWRPGGFDDPDARILQMLFANVALPFVVLAATGPLVQVWFARRHPSRSPYPLYAVSNIGSLFALLAYPFIIEPRLGLLSTSALWGVAFGACGVAVLACGFSAREPGTTEGTLATPDAAPTPQSVVSLWLLLPAAAVIVLMAVTNWLCLDLASVPFLWVLPLGVYLVSFIVCFGSERAYRRAPIVGLVLLTCLIKVLEPMLAGQSAPLLLALRSIYGQVVLHSLLLFGICMAMHGELYRLRPAPSRLTSFYLCVSGGGALGGLFVGVVAPRIFDGYHELQIGLGFAGALLLVAFGLDPRSALHFRGPRWRWAIAAPTAFVVLMLITLDAVRVPAEVVHAERNFFGTLRVYEFDPDQPEKSRRALTHGNTLHGVQFQHADARHIPTNYYGEATAIGLVLGARGPAATTHVGVVGLGAGTLAAYGHEGDRFRFYELDPDVIRLARDERYFSFLRDSAAQITLVPGDARLSLREEIEAGNPQEFDVLVLDAFSSDAIPIHLLTLEAFKLFSAHLREGGLIAAHLSNRHLQLAPLVFRLGQQLGMAAMLGVNREMPLTKTRASRWVLLSRDPNRLLAVRDAATEYRALHGLVPATIRFEGVGPKVLARTPVWTDDYSDLYRALKPLSGPTPRPSRPPGRPGV